MNFKRFISRSNPTIALKYDVIFSLMRREGVPILTYPLGGEATMHVVFYTWYCF